MAEFQWETSAGAVATATVPLGVSLPSDAPLAPGWTHEQLEARKNAAIGEMLRKADAAKVRDRVYTDGKLRVAVKPPGGDATKAVKFMAGHTLFSFLAGDVIEDPFVIELLDANGIAYDVLSAPESPVAKVMRKGRRGAHHQPAQRSAPAHGLPDDGESAGH